MLASSLSHHLSAKSFDGLSQARQPNPKPHWNQISPFHSNLMKVHLSVGFHTDRSVSRGEERSLLAREEPIKLLSAQQSQQWQWLSFPLHKGWSKPQLSFMLEGTSHPYFQPCLSLGLSPPATFFPAAYQGAE